MEASKAETPTLSPRSLLQAAGLSPQHFETAPSKPPTALDELQPSEDELATVLRPYVERNHPCVLRRVLAEWAPVRLWDDAHLRATCATASVPVRSVEAPDGRVGDPSRTGMYATEPSMVPLGDLLDVLADAEAHGSNAPVYAAQLRLRTHLPALFAETRPAPACLEALGPIWRNAPSMYIGCGARSPLHFDCLENVLCLVRGRKRIALWHPAHTPLLYAGGGGSSLFSQVDDVLSAEAHAAFPLLAEASALALHVELRAGDALYLPCGWWHDVRTPSGERSLSLSFWAQQPESKLLAASDEVVDPGEQEGAEAESRFAIR